MTLDTGTWFWIIWNVPWLALFLWSVKVADDRGFGCLLISGVIFWPLSAVAFLFSWYFWGFWLSLAGGVAAIACYMVPVVLFFVLSDSER